MAKAKSNTGKIKVTKIKSDAKRSKAQQETIRGLGLRKMNSSRVLNATPEVQGMVDAVAHLVKVEEV